MRDLRVRPCQNSIHQTARSIKRNVAIALIEVGEAVDCNGLFRTKGKLKLIDQEHGLQGGEQMQKQYTWLICAANSVGVAASANTLICPLGLCKQAGPDMLT